jgi:hypothetical protein
MYEMGIAGMGLGASWAFMGGYQEAGLLERRVTCLAGFAGYI